MAIKSNPADFVARWRAGVGAAGTRYTQGIQRTQNWAEATTSPQAIIARNNGLRRAMDDGSIDRGIQKLTSAGWRDATVAKAGNWQTGVNSQRAQANALAGANRLFGYLQSAESAISSTPRGTYEENKQRLVAWMDSMHASAQANK
jgi:hypothetical protein